MQLFHTLIWNRRTGECDLVRVVLLEVTECKITISSKRWIHHRKSICNFSELTRHVTITDQAPSSNKYISFEVCIVHYYFQFFTLVVFSL
jgi:hypothetical protein